MSASAERLRAGRALLPLRSQTQQRLAAVGLGAAAAVTLVAARRARPPARGVGQSRVVGPPNESPAMQRLAAWTPAPPRSRLGRIAAYLWASPVSAAGALMGLTTAAKPRLRDGVVLFAPARGIAAAALRARGFTATAWGHVVVSLNEPDAALMTHELVHVRHAERLGVLSAPLYLWLLAVRGYAQHPMERAARLAARRRLGAES